MNLLSEINSGSRPVVVSLFFGNEEKEQTVCRTIGEAREVVSRPLASRWRWALPTSQWLGESGDYEVDPYGPEVDEVRLAVFA